jgi:hypothetical protein
MSFSSIHTVCDSAKGSKSGGRAMGGEQARVLLYRGIGFGKPFSQLYSILSEKSRRRENFSQKAFVLPEGLRSSDENAPQAVFFLQKMVLGLAILKDLCYTKR